MVWRARPGDESDGPPIYGNTKVQATWIIGTTVIVLWLFVFGTVELVGPGGRGRRRGPVADLDAGRNAERRPGPRAANDMLQVQVIGQQWDWTYRYPQFGGMESTVLYLPVDTPIEFHVTSLDVIHSFWAYKLGVKADANPGVDNVAYTTAKATGRLQRPLQRAVRHLARRHVPLTATSSRRPRSSPGRPACRPRSRRTGCSPPCRRTR